MKIVISPQGFKGNLSALQVGSAIEFDYCCVHAASALRSEGYETIMVNCNPETVSTDYDTSDKLYFEPVTVEDVLSIYQKEKPLGVIVQFGGQTPLNIAQELAVAGAHILGTSPDSIDMASDRGRFSRTMKKYGIPMPEASSASTTTPTSVRPLSSTRCPISPRWQLRWPLRKASPLIAEAREK